MTLRFQALSEALVPIALASRRYFMDTEGARRFRAEAEVRPTLAYRPTLLGDCQDYSLLAVEVNDGFYTNVLDAFVLECLGEGLPIRLFVAAPAGGPAAQKLDLMRRARRRGIGVLEVDDSNVTAILPALSLSLIGVRRIDKKHFPKRFHSRLNQAEDTFRNGDPVKGCGRIYDTIERVSRSVALEIETVQMWRAKVARPKKKSSWFTTGPWANVLGYVDDYADFTALRKTTFAIDKALWGRVRGLTPHRNESGHEPATRAELQDRDRQLRTRFEHAVDTLAELLKACPTAAK